MCSSRYLVTRFLALVLRRTMTPSSIFCSDFTSNLFTTHNQLSGLMLERKARPTVAPRPQHGRQGLCMPGEVDSFQVKDEDGDLKTYSVTSTSTRVSRRFFSCSLCFDADTRVVVLVNKVALKYLGLPLANIGKPGTGVKRWVLLEMLCVHRPQILRSSGYLTSSRHVQGRTKDAILRSGQEYIRSRGQKFLNDSSKVSSCVIPLISCVFAYSFLAQEPLQVE
jgi:hypothetical protein